MKIVNYGENFKIYGDDLKTYDNLPAGTYKIAFHPMAGFSLVKANNFKSIEKIYGNHNEKIAKVLDSYDKFNRSLGVILSGEKGMGKSLFVQLLAEAIVKKGMPVIIVDKAYRGIADFIDEIKQEALIMFDEFEKVFSLDSYDGEGECQDSLLGLFDGISQQKRLYAITVNNLNGVSEFMLSRTGRFHYHIRFDYPSPQEIDYYLKDKLSEEYYDEIKHVISFSNRVKLNYDSLRAIAFELNTGRTFADSISDLNILSTDMQRYNFEILFSNGKTVTVRNYSVNMFRDNVAVSHHGSEWFMIEFNPLTAINDGERMIIDGKNVKFTASDDNEIYTEDLDVVSVTVTHYSDGGVNYRIPF